MSKIDDLEKLEDFVEVCGKITEEKGFDVSKTPEQTLLMVTELGEALEDIDLAENYGEDEVKMEKMLESVIAISNEIERIRSNTETDLDFEIEDLDHYIEELADVVIRIFSYVYGNDLNKLFIKILKEKIKTNADRDYLHGKKM